MEAKSEIDLPSSTWADIVSAADTVAASLFNSGRANIRITDDLSVRVLNSSMRGIDENTDVLSFPDESASIPGDIALSWDAVERQAKANGNSVEAECCALLAHGMLHLAGWDHPDDEAQERMDRKTIELCNLAGIEVTHFGH